MDKSTCETSGQYVSICKEHFEKIHRQLESIDDTIRGNGTAGIKERLSTVETYIKTIKENTSIIKTTLYGVGAMVLIMVLPWIFKLIVYVVPIIEHH